MATVSYLLFISFLLGYTIQATTLSIRIPHSDTTVCSSLDGPYCYLINQRRIPHHYHDLLRTSGLSSTSTSPKGSGKLDYGQISSDVLAQIGTILEKLKTNQAVHPPPQYYASDDEDKERMTSGNPTKTDGTSGSSRNLRSAGASSTAKRTHTIPGSRSSSRTTGRSQRTSNGKTDNPNSNNNHHGTVRIDTKDTSPPSKSDNSPSSSTIDTSFDDFVNEGNNILHDSTTTGKTPLQVHVQIDAGFPTVPSNDPATVSTETRTTMFEFDLDHDTLIQIYFHSVLNVQSIEPSSLVDILRQVLTDAITTKAPDHVRQRFLSKPNFGQFIQDVVENMVENIRRYKE